ncbi:MAG: cytochrome [Cyanobacteria bacterium RYN_339]|nr:cytochrome [Cyanobacteria bacterium RYN_339]
MGDLPMPIPLAAAKVALVVAFLLHIVFVNLMIGGTLIALAAHWRGRREPELLVFAKQLLDTVTVHKSLAVVLGIGPLLLISVAYTVPFYTSSTLIAPAWLSVLWLVTLAFLLLYGYKFGWDSWRLTRPRFHAGLGLAAAACLLVIPLIYLTNTNLMLDPAAWARRPGFFEAMLGVGNVLPRYLHFMLASLAVTGFWVALWWRRPKAGLSEEARVAVVRLGTLWALVPTALQFVAGPLVLFTLPTGAITPLMLGLLALGVVAGTLAIFQMIDSLRGSDRMPRAAALLIITICCMGSARHLIREALLDRASVPLSTGASDAKMFPVNLCNEGEDAHGHQPGSCHTAPQAPGGGPLRYAG